MYTVDDSVWVNGFDQRELGHVVSRKCLELLRAQACPIIEPTLALAEVAGAISRTRQDAKRAQTFATALSQLPHMTILPLDTMIIQQAIELATHTVYVVQTQYTPPWHGILEAF